MADRTTFNGASSPMPTGLQFLDQYADRIGQLFDASVLQLTGIGGSPDMVTAMLDPALPAGLVSGMKFTLSWASSNTGPMTLAINGGPDVPILTSAGSTMTQGAATAGGRALLEYVGGAFRVLSASGDAGGATVRHYWQVTASGTWNKPTGLPDDTMVTVEIWGGGGGSGGNCGGGGGGYALGRYLASALPATITVTIGSGGVGSTAGGNSNFGSILTAYGGGAGGSDRGGGGAGSGGAGGNGLVGVTGAGGRLGGGDGGAIDAHGGDAETLYGGGGGSGRNSYNGGDATYGGAGGAAGTGGLSAYGGNGGSNGQPGTAPGGGGGRNAAGARGEVRIWI